MFSRLSGKIVPTPSQQETLFMTTQVRKTMATAQIGEYSILFFCSGNVLLHYEARFKSCTAYRGLRTTGRYRKQLRIDSDPILLVSITLLQAYERYCISCFVVYRLLLYRCLLRVAVTFPIGRRKNATPFGHLQRRHNLPELCLWLRLLKSFASSHLRQQRLLVLTERSKQKLHRVGSPSKIHHDVYQQQKTKLTATYSWAKRYILT